MAGRRVIRGAAAAVFAVLLTAGLVGCSRSSDPVAVTTELDAKAVAAAADRTAGATTAKVHLVVATDVAGMGHSRTGTDRASLSFEGDGAYDLAAKRSTMTLDMGPMFDRMLSAMDGPAGTATGSSAPSFREEVVRDGDVLYVRMPELGALAPGVGGGWIKLDAAAGPSSMAGLFGGFGGGAGLGDPSAYLQSLRGVGVDLATVGHEAIDGVDTTHVRGTVTVRKALEAAGVDRARLEQAFQPLTAEQRASLDDLSFPVDVFIDAQGLVRRIRITYDLGSTARAMTPSSAQGGLPADATMTTSMTYDFRDLGAPVSIPVPPADQVTDLCAMVRSMAGRFPTATAGSTPTIPPGLC